VKQPDLVFFRVVEFGYGFGRRFGENLAVFTSNARIFSTASCSSSFGVCGERTISGDRGVREKVRHQRSAPLELRCLVDTTFCLDPDQAHV